MKYVIRRFIIGAMLVISGFLAIYWASGLYDWKSSDEHGVWMGLVSALIINLGIYVVFLGVIINMPRAFRRLRRILNKVS
jgi:uncharacterized membrane protein